MNNLTVKQYFMVVGIMTFLLICYLISTNAAAVQVMKEQLGLTSYLKANDNSFYQQRVARIFNKYCVACHDENKDKAGLRLDTYRQLSFGSKSGDMRVSPEINQLFLRMQLPENDRLAMPPYGRVRHRDDELAIVKLWLAKGASGQLRVEHFPEAPALIEEIHFEPSNLEQIAAERLKFSTQFETLKTRFPNTLAYIAQTSNLLEFSNTSLAPQINNESLQNLLAIAEVVAVLDINQSKVSDRAMPIITQMKELTKLKIANTNITAKGVTALLDKPNKLSSLMIHKGQIPQMLIDQLIKKGIHVITIGELKE